jgi:hypothetical protein
MAGTPVSRRVEFAGPDSALFLLRNALFALVVAIGNCPTTLNLTGIEVDAIRGAGCEQPTVSIRPASLANDMLPVRQGSQRVLRVAPARIWSAVERAGLRKLWRVDAEEPDAPAAQLDRIAVDDADEALLTNGIEDVQPRRHQCAECEDRDRKPNVEQPPDYRRRGSALWASPHIAFPVPRHPKGILIIGD